MSERPKPTLPNIDPALPPSTDPLVDVLQRLKLTGVLNCRAEFSAPWGIELPPMAGCMALEVVTEGACWLEVAGESRRRLERGSLVLLPHGDRHRLVDAEDSPSMALEEIPVDRIGDRFEVMRHGGGGAITRIMYCGVRYDPLAAARLVDLLPRMILLEAGYQDRWSDMTVQLIAGEAENLRPGVDIMMTRLADLLVIQAIRTWLEQAPEADHGWLRALRDPKIGHALSLMHRFPGRQWTVSSLARAIGLSRSGLHARFQELVGQPVMAYLTEWRLQQARQLIRSSRQSLARIAESCGYGSEAAFSRAYRRQFGLTPGRDRTSPNG